MTKPHLPVSRVSTIMKSCSNVDVVGKEAAMVMCKAAEFFIRTLAGKAYRLTNNGRKLGYNHLSKVVHGDERYEFLSEMIPQKITVLEFKRLMAKKAKLQQQHEENVVTSSDDEDMEQSSSLDSDNSSSSSSISA